MIYITFDTNIWIYSLSDSWKTENELDYLEYWLETGKVKVLLPEIIKAEWYRNRDENVKDRKKALYDFFNMAKDILPSAFYQEYATPDARNKIVDQQLERINQIINNADIITMSDNIPQMIVANGIDKKAPLHKKSSVADAIIIYSLFEYVEKHPYNQYYFVTNNTEDFYIKENKKYTQIHPDLKLNFDKLGIQPYKEFNRLRYDLVRKFSFPDDADFESKRNQNLKKQIQNQIYNPFYENLATDVSVLFTQNKKMLDFILNEKKPTKEQVIFVLSLIDSDSDYERHFYKKASGITWFEILLKKGIFKAKNISNNTPWLPVVFLKRLTRDVSSVELSGQIVNILKELSKRCTINSALGFEIVEILIHIPSKWIPIDIFKNVPLWIQDKNDYMTAAREISEKLLPKLAQEEPQEKNQEKITSIVKHLLMLQTEDSKSDESFSFDSRYTSPIERLLDVFNDELIDIIVSACPEQVIEFLIEQLKVIYYDYPNGLSFNIQEDGQEQTVKLKVCAKTKTIELTIPDSETSIQIDEFDKKGKRQLYDIINKQLLENSYHPIIVDDKTDSLQYSLNYLIKGHSFVSSGYGIEEYESEHQSDRVEIAFVVILRKIVNQYLIKETKQGLILLKHLFVNDEYGLAVIKQICLYIIGENWHLTNDIFEKVLTSGMIDRYFYGTYYDTDLWRLINRKQLDFNTNTLDALKKITDNPPSEGKYERPEYWQLKWYSALKDIPDFAPKYSLLSEQLNLDAKHFARVGRTQFFSGERSPITIEEFSEMTNSQITSYIIQFKPDKDFASPSISGLGRVFQDTVKANPSKFSKNTESFKSLSYVYIYYMLYGFYYAWQENKEFNWETVIDFISDYTTSEQFKNGKLQAEDDLRADESWVIGIAANLLGEGIKTDEKRFNLELLPKVKKILLIFSQHLKSEPTRDNNDFIGSSLNTTSGKVLRALIDYSLCNARNRTIDKKVLWEQDIKMVFDDALKNDVVDAFTLVGMYYRQFKYFADAWVLDKMTRIQTEGERNWKAFWNGYLFSGFIPNKRNYKSYTAHYERAIEQTSGESRQYRDGLGSHIASFYSWEYESLQDNGIVAVFCEKASTTLVLNFVSYLSDQKEYPSLLSSDEKTRFENRIVELWTYLTNRFKGKRDKTEIEILSRLSRFTRLISSLNSEIVDLVLLSSPLIDKSQNLYGLIKELLRLCNTGSPKETAKHVARILKTIPVDSFSFYLNEEMPDVLVFLLENGQKEIALKFCDDRVRLGDESFNVLIDRYK